MDFLKSRILELEKTSRKLDPPAAERSEYNKQFFDFAGRFIDDLAETDAYSSKAVEPARLKLDGEKKGIQELLGSYLTEVIETGIKPASGSHLGYIPGGGIYAAALADYIAAVSNEYAGVSFASPGGVMMENELLNWLKGLFGFPESAVGNLTSGGSIATLIAFTAARDRFKIKSANIPESVIYMSAQVHHCMDKALRIIGLEDVVIRYVALDEGSRIDSESLKGLIESDTKDGLNPFMIVASVGTTNTGAVDPLDEIGEVARQFKLWYHIDAAYGGFFVLCDSKKHLFEGIETADSLVVDPHKGLFLPFGIGALLVKDVEAVFHSHHYLANYMQDAFDPNAPVNPSDVSPELSKHFRGLRMWLPLQLHGIEPFTACLNEKLLLTEYFRKRLVEIGFKVGPDPDLTVSYFWYPSKNEDENAFNKKLMKLIHEDGRVFLSSTTIDEKFVIRMAILSFRTRLRTIDLAIDMIDGIRKNLGD